MAIAGRATVVLALRASRVVGNVEGLQGGGIPAMVTSFTDDTEVSCGQTIVANATGFRLMSRVSKIEATSVRALEKTRQDRIIFRPMWGALRIASGC